MRKKILFLMLLLSMVLVGNAGALNVSPTSDANTLVSNLLGSGVSLVGAPTLTGIANQQGTFSSGAAEIGFASGVVLTSGNATLLPGANAQSAETKGVGDTTNDNFSTDLGTAGDANLGTISGYSTFDANVLSFSFQFGDGTAVDNSLYFNFVFGSEEYIDYVGTNYNDVFAFFVDGVNIAKIGGAPITINNVNDTSNSAYYINNVANTNGLPVAGKLVLLDGLTTVFQASATGLGAGVHTMEFGLADASDHILDAAVFIQEGTFSTTPTGVPEPATLLLLGFGLAGLATLRKESK